MFRRNDRMRLRKRWRAIESLNAANQGAQEDLDCAAAAEAAAVDQRHTLLRLEGRLFAMKLSRTRRSQGCRLNAVDADCDCMMLIVMSACFLQIGALLSGYLPEFQIKSMKLARI